MARLVLPITFENWAKLSEKVVEKHNNDLAGTGSVLTTFLTEEEIDMADHNTQTVNAKNDHKAFEKHGRDLEKFSKERDNIFAEVFSHHRAMVQFLKKVYRKNPNKLGDWSVTVNENRRIVYPVPFEERQQQVVDFIAKHNDFAPGTSPLEVYLTENDIDIAEHETDADDALTNHNDFKEQDQLKEQMRESRDNYIEPVKENLRGIGGYLVNLYEKNPHKAGDWGYIIDDSPKGSVAKTFVIGAGKTKTVNNVVIGSILQTGELVNFNLYKGKTATGGVIELGPGANHTVEKGYGTLTLKNMSDTPGTIVVVVRKS